MSMLATECPIDRAPGRRKRSGTSLVRFGADRSAWWRSPEAWGAPVPDSSAPAAPEPV